MSPVHQPSLAALALLALSFATVAAQAQSVRVRCDTFPNRSRASVDGRDLATGQYVATLASGANQAQGAPEPTVAGEVQVDFDSNAKDVAAGATKISRHFIVGNRVTGAIVDASGQVVVSETRTCKAH